jgi:hypothetical protein
MAAVMIGVDPHKASHTAVAINEAEQPLGELRVRACAVQVANKRSVSPECQASMTALSSAELRSASPVAPAGSRLLGKRLSDL